MKRIWFPFACLLALGVCSGLVYCSSSSSSSGGTSSTGLSRTLIAQQTAGTSVSTTYGGTCTMQTLDNTSCQSARTALGLSNQWLKFSCNVVLGLATSSGDSTTDINSATYVTLTFVDLPNYTSNYYATSGTYSFTANSYTVTGNYSDLYAAYTTTYANPNKIAQQSLTVSVPLNPTASASGTSMGMGVTGVSVNGIGIYNNEASSTDNIFAEAGSFDQCQGHPSSENSGTYHYHSEPYSISYNDDALIGVMRDGFFIYGRKDGDGTDVSTDSGTEWTSSDSTGMYKFGGHVGPLPDQTGTSKFHYHATKWTGCYHQSTSGGTTTHYNDDGATGGCASGSGGTAVSAYFLSGHGNGGVFMTVPTFSGTTYSGYPQATSQQTAGHRYYYGTAGSCTGCN